jgi:hydrogenase/urease accessory protein HupE
MKNFSHFFLFLVLLIFPSFIYAHTVNYNLESAAVFQTSLYYLKTGFLHIIPYGFDHILFIIAVYLLQPKLKIVLLQATVFTIAHSITLGLALYGVIRPVSNVIEPVIALSIVFIGLENIFTSEIKWWRIILIFLFGLVHGCGFAGALMETGLPEGKFMQALLFFNIGVECGQIAIIFFVWVLLGKWFTEKPWYRKRIQFPLSFAISLIALYWVFERLG